MKTIDLAAEIRKELKKEAQALRSDDKVPAVVYGGTEEPVNISIKLLDFERAIAQGENNFINLTLADGKTQKAMIQDYQINKISLYCFQRFFTVGSSSYFVPPGFKVSIEQSQYSRVVVDNKNEFFIHGYLLF